MYKPILKTRFIGKNLNSLTSCHSTNDIAAHKVRSGLAENGEIVITEEQTAGRGQRGAVWESESGKNLTFSLILMPEDLAVSDGFLLSQCIAAGVHEYVANEVGPDAKIKWPNDILIGEKKTAGISIDNVIRGSRIVSVVVGIGLNINQMAFSNSRITSLGLATAREFFLDEEFEKLAVSLDRYYAWFHDGNLKEIQKKYLAEMFALGEKRNFLSGGEPFSGVVSGIAADGRLLIVTDGTERYFDIKEIVWQW